MSQQNKAVIYLFLLFLCSQNAFTQNYYNSPYTRYKIGELINQGFSYNRSLGGSSIALRPKNQINYLNPASYTAQDTNSFLFQTGLTGRYALVSSNLDQDESFNVNINYLSIGFPLAKWCGMSVGVAPFSRIQYFVREERNEELVGEPMTFDYSGFGGLNEFYFGTGFEIKNMVSIGAHAGYIFGSLDRKQESYLTEIPAASSLIERRQNYIVGDLYYKLGIQIHPTFGNHTLILGATYDFETNIDVKLKGSATRYHTATSYNFSPDSLSFNLEEASPFYLPAKLGIGISYSYKDFLTATAEYMKQDWSGTNIVYSNFRTGLYESYRFGVEVYPAPLKKNKRITYFDRVKYRFGGNITKSYLYYDDENIGSWGFSAGLGLPIKNSRKLFTGTVFNLGYSYIQKGTTDLGLIKENVHIITFGFTLHDFWFLKPKYD